MAGAGAVRKRGWVGWGQGCQHMRVAYVLGVHLGRVTAGCSLPMRSDDVMCGTAAEEGHHELLSGVGGSGHCMYYYMHSSMRVYTCKDIQATGSLLVGCGGAIARLYAWPSGPATARFAPRP